MVEGMFEVNYKYDFVFIFNFWVLDVVYVSVIVNTCFFICRFYIFLFVFLVGKL